MKRLSCLFSMFVVISIIQISFAQIYQSGLFFGGSANLLLMDDKGKMGESDLNVTDDLINYSDDDKLGWGWKNKLLYGLKQYLGYKISNRLAIVGSFNYYFQKKGEQSGTEANLIVPISSSIELNEKAKIEFNQNVVQLMCQFYPLANSNYYFSFGADYILMKTNVSYTAELSDPDFGMSSSVTYTSKGNDNTIGLVFGAGLELPIFQHNYYFTADINYSLAKYKGDDLIGDSYSSEDGFDYEEKLKMELAVGGISANVGLRMYLTGTKEIGVSPEQCQKISLNKISFTPNAGIAKAVGEGSEYWKLGFSAGVDIFYENSSAISLGGRLAYNRIFPNGEKIMDLASGIPGASYDYKLQSTSGSLSVVELVPSARIALSPAADSTGSNLFIQCGAGLFFIDSDASATGKYESATVKSTMKISVKGESETKAGLQVGLGVNVGNRMSILSLFSIIFSEEEEMKYFSLNLGINLGN